LFCRRRLTTARSNGGVGQEEGYCIPFLVGYEEARKAEATSVS
jgi:hypothetical protein